MLFLYRVYQICVMLPLMLAATVITALTAIAGARSEPDAGPDTILNGSGAGSCAGSPS